jgi:carbon-monoxide dehydrogenase large subunit
MDPAAVRFQNLLPRFTEPHTTAVGTVYDVGDYPEALRLALEAADYESLRSEQAHRRESEPRGGKHLGIGLSCYVEITAGRPESEYGEVELQPDGRVRVTSGSVPFGQGHDTTWAMIVSDRTGVALDQIDVVHGDTDLVPRGGLTVGSRSVQLGGVAIAEATTRLIDRARNEAARLLEAAVDDVVLDPSVGFHVAGTPAHVVDWAAIAAAATDEPLAESSDFTAPNPTFPSGAHVAIVEVDGETGATELLRVVAADDAGTILNPLLFDGQVHGGIAQGVAQALLEEVVYDEDGNLLTSNFMDYPVISTTELPSFETVHVETPTWVNELGAKGVGESGTIGSIPAVYNAVIDAVSHLGVTHLTTPLTAERLWSAIRAPSS